jgi:hypothetical protein
MQGSDIERNWHTRLVLVVLTIAAKRYEHPADRAV